MTNSFGTRGVILSACDSRSTLETDGRVLTWLWNLGCVCTRRVENPYHDQCKTFTHLVSVGIRSISNPPFPWIWIPLPSSHLDLKPSILVVQGFTLKEKKRKSRRPLNTKRTPSLPLSPPWIRNTFLSPFHGSNQNWRPDLESMVRWMYKRFLLQSSKWRQYVNGTSSSTHIFTYELRWSLLKHDILQLQWTRKSVLSVLSMWLLSKKTWIHEGDGSSVCQIRRTGHDAFGVSDSSSSHEDSSLKHEHIIGSQDFSHVTANR